MIVKICNYKPVCLMTALLISGREGVTSAHMIMGEVLLSIVPITDLFRGHEFIEI